jgi:hypothetical protein
MWTDEDAQRSIQLWKKERVKKVVGAVEAWRAWRTEREADGSVCLMSITAYFKWEGPVVKVDPPISWEWDTSVDARHSGIHAFRSLEIARAELDCPEAVGTVSLSGKVMVHQFGYRAEKALITKLWVPSFHTDLYKTDITHLEERYQCDVVMVRATSWEAFWEGIQNG